MSAQPASVPQRHGIIETPRRGLRTVGDFARNRKPKLSYALIAVGGAAAIGIAQLGLSLAITSDAYVLADLNAQQSELNLQAQALQESLDGMGSPQQLATAAAGLGLVVGGTPSYLTLSSGAVSGSGETNGWTTTVNPTGPGAVANALLQPKQTTRTDDAAPAPVTPVDPAAPPTITEGLPSPATH